MISVLIDMSWIVQSLSHHLRDGTFNVIIKKNQVPWWICLQAGHASCLELELEPKSALYKLYNMEIEMSILDQNEQITSTSMVNNIGANTAQNFTPTEHTILHCHTWQSDAGSRQISMLNTIKREQCHLLYLFHKLMNTIMIVQTISKIVDNFLRIEFYTPVVHMLIYCFSLRTISRSGQWGYVCDIHCY